MEITEIMVFMDNGQVTRIGQGNSNSGHTDSLDEKDWQDAVERIEQVVDSRFAMWQDNVHGHNIAGYVLSHRHLDGDTPHAHKGNDMGGEPILHRTIV